MRVRQSDRETLARELRELADGWEHLGNPARQAEAKDALVKLAAGAMVVRVGHSEYRVERPTGH